MRIHPFFIAAFVFLLFTAGQARDRVEDLKPYAGKTITSIEIVRKNIFDDQLADTVKSPFYYKWANALHIMTKESVVRRELLFKVGDQLDPEKVIETERNLRLSNFIGEADVQATPDSLGGVDLSVITTDLWTTQVSLFADLAGGRYATGVDLDELNLFGYGKGIDILGQIGNDQDGYQVLYTDNRLFNSRLALGLKLNDFTFENGFSIGLSRPQYSLSVPTIYGGVYSRLHLLERLFHNGKEYFRYRNERETFALAGTYVFGKFRRLSISTFYDYDSHNYSPDDPSSRFNYLIPPDEKLSYPSLGLGASIIHYDVERYIDAPGIDEDLTLGGILKGTLGYSTTRLGSTYTGYRPSITAQFLTKTSSRAFFGGRDIITWWYHNNRNERIRHITEGAFYYKPLDTHVLVLHAMTDFAWRQKSTYQIFLGGGNGLRGHSFYELAGTKLAVGNIEYRFYLPIEILTVKLGAAAFFDIGNVWQSNQSVRLRDFKSDVGIGLRLGMTKSAASRVLNIDIARSLSRNKFFITLTSSGSLFRLGNLSINE